MHRLILAASVLCSFLFAGNALYFTGVSPTSKSLGGTGVANATSSVDAASKNPALLGDLPFTGNGVEATLNASVIKHNATAATGAGEKSSSANAVFVPAASGAYKVNDKFAIGLSAFPYGGALANYTGEASIQEFKVDYAVTQIGPSASYKILDNWSVGLAPYLAYGSMALNNKNPVVPGATQTTREPDGAVGYGIKVGTSFSPMKNLTFGAGFSPKVRLKYEQVLDIDALNLLPAAQGGTSGVGDGVLDNLELEDPMQISLGAAYQVTSEFKVTMDGRFIGWSSADIFKELGWRDQYVLALGLEYRIDKFPIRAGFNYARGVFDDIAGEVGTTPVSIAGKTVIQQSLSNLNVCGVPGISATHLSLGTGYEFSENLSADFSVVYVPKTTVTRAGTGITTAGLGAYSYTGTVSQWSVGLGGTYRF